MKKELDIPTGYIKELWSFYEDEVQSTGLSFPEHLFCEFATDPAMYAALELGGFCPENENVKEFENMTEHQQEEEIEVRFKFFVKKAGEILGKHFPERPFTEIKANAMKVLGY